MHVLKNLRTSKLWKAAFALEALVFGLLFFITPHLYIYSDDTGFKYLKNYSYRDYDHQVQNWGIVQAKNRIIYVANQGGALEFDGVSWRVINVHNFITRSLDIDKTGTLYIGGKDEIGYLDPDSKGSLRYVSLLKYLDDNCDCRNFSDVWSTHAVKEKIYFRASRFLFRWDPGSKKIKKWKTSHSYKASFFCAGNFFVQEEKKGLLKVVNDSFTLIPGGETFAEEKIRMIVPYDDGNFHRLLMGTQSKGFYLYDGKTLTHFPMEAEVTGYLKERKFYHGIRLSDGDFALATLFGGLIIMDPQGRRKYIFDKTYGLQDDNVKYVFQDMQGNLWLCLDRGISKIEYASPICIHDERSNLPGSVLSVIKHLNDLYAGTTKGLYYLESPLKFRLITGISSICWNLASIDDSLLAATTDGVFHVDNKKNIKRKVLNGLSYVLLPSTLHPGRTWCGTSHGLVVLSLENGQWMRKQRFENIGQEIQSIVEDKKGNLWLGTLTGSVFKVDYPDNINPPVTRYDDSHGLPGGEIWVGEAAGRVIFATTRGLFRFDEKAGKFIPDGILGTPFAGGEEPIPVFRLIEDKNKNIWFHSRSRNFQALPGPGKSFTIYSTPFLRIPTAQVNAIYPDPDGKTTWFAGVDGLIRYDTTIKKDYRKDFPTLVRRVMVNQKEIFNGYKNNNDNAEPAGGFFPVIEYRERNLRFEFAAPFFEAETETRYRCFLEGYDDDWSPWNKETRGNYTNLDSGLYTFRVQARNVYHHPGNEDVFRFKILPPWYMTWWAFLLYGAGFFLFVFLIVKWRAGKLEQEKQKLEHTVKERTKEIHEKNQQLEKQTIQLKEQSEKLKEMDKVKSRFFANISHEFRTPLTLIMGPLEQMLSDARDQKQKDQLKVMLRNSQRVLTLINQLLDLSRFDSGKMKLQAARQNIVPFLKGIWASFHMLAQQNKLGLEFHCDEEDISLFFDAQKMEEMMVNLLINAVKFTPAGGEITVSVSLSRRDHQEEMSVSRDFVKISVCDTGIGIPREQLPYIFERFYQAGGPGEKAHKGTGIGLALTKEIVLLHHGKIDVHSQEGKGTEFVILLPLGHEHLKPDEIASSSETVPGHKRAGDFETLYMMEEVAGKDAGEEGDENGEIRDNKVHENKVEEQEKNVILVVEDNADVRKYIRDPLERLYTVVEAADGKEGIDKAKEIIPDLIVSDIMMPEKDGCELCRELKKDVRTSHIPIILLTAKASEENIIQGLETGADDYITKPFNTKILMTRIKNLVELRRQLQQKIQKQMLLQPAEISVSSVDREFIKELQEIIEKNLSDPGFHVEELSKKLYMNRATLYRKIMALTGESPTEFIRSYRLKRAAQLLRDNFGNVSQVSLEVGFTNMAYFARCFKEKFQQLPSTYQTSESK